MPKRYTIHWAPYWQIARAHVNQPSFCTMLHTFGGHLNKSVILLKHTDKLIFNEGEKYDLYAASQAHKIYVVGPCGSGNRIPIEAETFTAVCREGHQVGNQVCSL